MEYFNYYKDKDRMERDAADLIISVLANLLESQERVSLVLTGGSSVKGLYHKLTEKYANFNWSRISFFITDERAVPPVNEYSNFNMILENFFSILDIPSENIHRIKCELDPETAASDYQSQLLDFFDANNTDSFDLMLLGIGPDGHIASLFPGYHATGEMKKLVVPTERSLTYPRVPRVTLTFPAINSTRNLIFYTGEKNKEQILANAENPGQEEISMYPVYRIKRHMPRTWFIWQN